MASRRRFGRVRRLPSGRYQARYRGSDGLDRPAPGTFATKTEAEKWLARTEVDIQDDLWLDPDLGRVNFGEYAAAWIRERPGLRPSTVEVYGYVLARHLQPFFGNREGSMNQRIRSAAVAEQLLSVEAVAERLDTKPRFVRRLIAERRIEYHKVGRHVRISESALADFIAAGVVEPVTRERRRVA